MLNSHSYTASPVTVIAYWQIYVETHHVDGARRYVSKQALWLAFKGSVWFGPPVLKLYPAGRQAGRHCFHYAMALAPYSPSATAQAQRARLGNQSASLNINSFHV